MDRSITWERCMNYYKKFLEHSEQLRKKDPVELDLSYTLKAYNKDEEEFILSIAMI